MKGAPSRGSFALALAALLVASLVYWAPIVIDPVERVAGGAGDPMLIAYLVTWVAEHLFMGQAWNPPFLHPAQNVLAYSDHLFGLAFLAWPAVLMDVPPTVIVNAISWFAFFLTSVTLFWWLCDSRGEVLPAFAATLCVTYGAWRVQQLPHPQITFVPFLPLALMCYARAIERRGPGWLIGVGAALLAFQTLCTPSLSVFMLPLVSIWIVISAVINRRSEPRLWIALGLSLVIIGVVNLPLAAHYWQLGGALDRSPVDIARFSAGWRDWVSISAHHWLYGDRLAFTRGLERELFPGIGFIAVLAIGIAAITASDRAGVGSRWPAMIAAALALWAAAGPSAPGEFTLLHLPYDVLVAVVPGARQVRVPARFVVLAAIFLAPAIAAGWSQALHWISRRCSSRLMGHALLMLLALLTVAEGLPGLAAYERVSYLRDEAVPPNVASRGLLFLPLSDPAHEIRRMWLARRSRLPVVNGYTGHSSQLLDVLRSLQGSGTDDETRRAVYSRLLHVGVDTIVTDSPVPSLVDAGTLRQLSDRVYRIPPDVRQPNVRPMALGRGAGLLVPDFGWSYAEGNADESWVWSIDRRAAILVPMNGRPTQIAFRARSLHPDNVESIELWWNGQLLGAQPLRREAAVISFPLPEAATRDGWTRFELVGPPPVRVPGSVDPRRLSVCVYEIMLR
jgi:hypothetical protein